MEIKLLNIEHFFNFSHIDLSRVTWVEPLFIVAYKAYMEDNSIDPDIDNSYINKMLTGNYQSHTTYSPVEHIVSRMEIEATAAHIADVILKNLNIANADILEISKLLKYLLTEIMNNVADHARSPVGGFAMAQYYPNKNTVQFAIADRGIGFLKNVQAKMPDIVTENEAIELAMKKGFTASSQKLYGHERNAGYGLYAFSKIVEHIGGKFVIVSNDSIYKKIGSPTLSKKIGIPYKGVIVGCELKLNNVTLTFEDFLEIILDDKDEELY